MDAVLLSDPSSAGIAHVEAPKPHPDLSPLVGVLFLVLAAPHWRRGRPFVISPPLHAGQALTRRLLLPVRPRIGADDAAARAHHARPERRHRHVIGPRVRAHNRPVVGERLIRPGAAV
jgi:hypothetical protein